MLVLFDRDPDRGLSMWGDDVRLVGWLVRGDVAAVLVVEDGGAGIENGSRSSCTLSKQSNI